VMVSLSDLFVVVAGPPSQVAAGRRLAASSNPAIAASFRTSGMKRIDSESLFTG